MTITDVDIQLEIDRLKQLLEKIVKDHDFNFQHPDVLAISQELDVLILAAMKSGPCVKSNKQVLFKSP